MAKILVISPTPSHPQDAGNRVRIFSLLSVLRRIGHEVHFVYLDRVGHSRDLDAMEREWDGFHNIAYRQPSLSRLKKWHDFFTRILGWKRVLPYGIDDWFDNAISRSVSEIAECLKPDVVLVEYVFVSKILDLFDDHVLKIIDTHDVFGGRHQLFFRNKLKPQWFYTSISEEKKGLERADLILAIQSQEAEYFKQISHRKVLTVGHLVQPNNTECPKKTHPPRLLFVGSSNNINLDGINWFVGNIFNELRTKYIGLEIDIVGTVCDFIEPSPGLNLHGAVEDLIPFYLNAMVVINPLQFGSGLKIKTVEALAMKRPLVTTSAGSAGIEEWAGRAFLCGDTPGEFIAAIQQIINDGSLRDSLKKGAEEFTDIYNKNAFMPLKSALDLFLDGKHSSSNPVVIQ